MSFSLPTLAPQSASSRRGILLLVAVALLLALALRAGFGWYTDYSRELDATIDAKALQYEKLMRLLAEADTYTKERDALTRLDNANLENRFVRGATPSLSEAAFQNLIKDMAQKNNITLRTLRSLPPIKKDGLTLLQLSINSRSEIDAIRNFLLTVRNSEKFVYFSEVEIKATQYHEAQFFNFTAKLTALTRE